MDRMLYLAMSGAKQMMQAQAVNNNNLANANTTGFKADLEQFRSMPVYGQGMPSRVYAMSERPGTDLAPGSFNTTGRDLDVAIRGEGWIAVQTPAGEEAYTRAGNLRVEADGILVNGAGQPLIGNSGGPITLPPFDAIEIGGDGSISIRPVGQPPNVLAEVDRIKLVNPAPDEITKGKDGLMHLIEERVVADPDAAVQLVPGALEGSNVNAVDAMVKMIELQRQYEMQVKMMKTAKDNDASAASILRLS